MNKEEIKQAYKRVFFDTLNKIVKETLLDNGFPEGKQISFKGSKHSKMTDQKFWYEEDEDGNIYFRSNMVEGKPGSVYVTDFNNIELLEDVFDKATSAVESYKAYKEVEDWIKADKPCVYRYGWAYRGAGARLITKEKALEIFPRYHFGAGFYELGWTTYNGEKAVEFNELSENDMW